MGQNAYKNIVYSALDTLQNVKYEGSLAKINRDMATCFELVHRPHDLDIAERAVKSLASLDIAIVLSIYRKLRKTAKREESIL